MSVQIHYALDNILLKQALYNLIYGEKSNGKSYAVKHYAIKDYIENHHRFILLRRWKEDISNLWIEQYFHDVDVEKLTNKKYNCITCYRKVLYFSFINEDGKVKRGEKIGYVMALSTEQHYSGASFLDVFTIIYEEFMERGSYIAREPQKFSILYSTVDRKRGTTKVFFVGNTITKVCPYLTDWNLLNTVKAQKQGEIKVIEFENVDINGDKTKIKIALEYCRSSGGKQLAIGSAKTMIETGEWQTEPQPKLPKSRKLYKKLFNFILDFKGFRFCAEFLADLEDKNINCWFIYPTKRQIKNNDLVITDKVSTSQFFQRDIYNITIKNNNLQKLLDTFRETNIFYSDDLTRYRF